MSAVDLDLTEEQRLIAGTVRDFVERELYPHEDEVERLDEVLPDLAAQIRAKAIKATCARTCPPNWVAVASTRPA